MLKIMSHKFFTVFLLSGVTVIIIITFIFWGIGPKDRNQETVVAQVEDEKISTEKYWRAYENELKRLKDANPNMEEPKKEQLREQVLNMLVDRTVLAVAAQKAGITIPEKDLQDAIVSIPYFQRDGVFDPEIYSRALRLNRLTAQAFENDLREDLLVSKMSKLIGETAELTPDEIKILDSIGTGNQEQLLQIFRSNKSNQIINAYIESVKRQLKITVNKDIIS
ncbi:MAG: SurA N-terminal domain-containing protein [Nitrospirae bacterium]|nr:SurA N-terminal domain-containing protein [Nitrospirota bacterium]